MGQARCDEGVSIGSPTPARRLGAVRRPLTRALLAKPLGLGWGWWRREPLTGPGPRLAQGLEAVQRSVTRALLARQLGLGLGRWRRGALTGPGLGRRWDKPGRAFRSTPPGCRLGPWRFGALAVAGPMLARKVKRSLTGALRLRPLDRRFGRRRRRALTGPRPRLARRLETAGRGLPWRTARAGRSLTRSLLLKPTTLGRRFQAAVSLRISLLGRGNCRTWRRRRYRSGVR
jgi:hypothetical protein